MPTVTEPIQVETAAPLCLCGCGQPVKPGRKLAGKPCIPRFNRGRKTNPEARARMQAAAKERVKRTGRVIQPANPTQAPIASPVVGAHMSPEQAVSLALHWLRQLPNDGVRSLVYQLACQMEVGNDT